MKLRTLLASAAVTIAAVGVAPAADAIEPQPTPEPNPGSALYSVTGSVSLGCAVPASTVRVRIRPITSGASLWRTVTPSETARGITYTITGLNRDLNYIVQPALESVPEDCRYGRWSPGERQVGPPPPGSNVRSGVNFTYEKPSSATTIGGQNVATAVGFALLDTDIHLNNDGSDDSYVEIAGERDPISIPPKVKRICRLGGRVCIGEARFYVNDVNLRGNPVATWGGGLNLDLAFESEGREIIGEGSNPIIGPFVPDAELKDVRGNEEVSARVRVRLVLAANDERAVTYRLVEDPALSTRVELVDGCSDVFGANLCPDVDDAVARARTRVVTRLKAHLESSRVREKLDAKLREGLASFGVTHPVDAVITTSTGFVLVEY